MSEIHMHAPTEEQRGRPMPDDMREANAAAAANKPPELDLGEAVPDRAPAEMTAAEEAEIAAREAAGRGLPAVEPVPGPEEPRSVSEALSAAQNAGTNTEGEFAQPPVDTTGTAPAAPSGISASMSLRERIAMATEELAPGPMPPELEPDELEALRAEFPPPTPDEPEAEEELPVGFQALVETVALVEQLHDEVEAFKSDVATEFARLEARVAGHDSPGELVIRMAKLEGMLASLVNHIQKATGVTVKL